MLTHEETKVLEVRRGEICDELYGPHQPTNERGYELVLELWEIDAAYMADDIERHNRQVESMREFLGKRVSA
jgi:hypothetical protein